MTRKEIKTKTAKFLKFVEWSDEDQVFIGRCPALFSGGIHGDDETEVYKELVETVVEWVEMLSKEGRLPEPDDKKKYSGKFVVRVDSSLHRRLAAKAQLEGESLNQYVAQKLAAA